jgi:hypothetical protein
MASSHHGDYQHSHFEGVSLAPNGCELLLDYFDHDQGGTRLCFRYVLPLGASPKRITGYAHESSRSEREIRFGEIPRHVFREAADWLIANAEIARTHQRDTLAQTLTHHLEHLRRHENDD